MTVVTKRNARRSLLASTALIAAVAALPAYAQTQIAAPQGGGTITGSGGESVTDNTPVGGGISITSASAPITFSDVAISNTTGFNGEHALSLIHTLSATQSLVLNGSNSFATAQPGGVAFRAQTLGSDLSVTLDGGMQSFSGVGGMYLYAMNSLDVTNNGGPLSITATGSYGVFSRGNIGAATLNLGAANITATAGTGIITNAYGNASVTTSGGAISAQVGISASSYNITTIISGSTITGTGTGQSIGIIGYGQDTAARVEITSNGAISNVNQGIYLQNQTGLAGNIIRANANITASSAGIDTGNSSSTNIYVGSGAIVAGGVSGIARSSIGTTYNSGTIRGGVGITSSVASTVENSGAIDGSTFGVNFLSGGTLTNNSGATITGGGTGGHGVNVAGAAGTIDNRGTITVGNAAGIMLSAGGTATNYATINASGNNSTGLRNNGVAATLDNRGTITANIGIRADVGGSTINNSGTINATSFAIYVPNGTATLTNSGTVNGAVGATLNGGGSITNTGSLIGVSYGITASGAATTVINDGIVSGGSGAMTLSTLNDTVTLNSGSTTTGSINLSSGNDTLNIMTGATFGALAGGAGTDTLALGGTTTGTLNLADVATFEILNKVGTGTWTLTGAALSPAMAITSGNGTPSGTLIFNGTGLTGTIAVNGAAIRALSAGAFGSGTITALQPTIQYGATGIYTNPIVLAAADPVNTPTRLEADASVTATLTGQISQQSAGQALVIGGAGTIELTNITNNWNGGIRIENGATLLASRTALGSVANLIRNNGTVIFNESGSTTQTGMISGSGTLVKRGTGTLIIDNSSGGYTASNGYTGATIIEAGTLQIKDKFAVNSSSSISLTGGTAIFDNDSSDGVILNNLSGVAGSQVRLRGKSTTLANSVNTIFEGTISGEAPAGVTKSGSGTLTLTGNNVDLTMPVIIAGGSVALTGAGSIANAGYVGLNSGSFDISGLTGAGTSIKELRGLAGSNVALGDKRLTITAGDSSNYYHGTLSGTGGVTITGGVTTLTGASSYSGSTLVSSGQLTLSGAGSLANSDMMVNGSVYVYNDAVAKVRSLSGSGYISMSGGTLTVANGGLFTGQFGNGVLVATGGTLVLTGNNGLSSTTLNGGNITLGNGGAGANLGGTIALTNGTLTINKSDDYTISNVSGAGNLVQAGSGMTTVYSSSYTGSTSVTGGMLRLMGGDALSDSSDLSISAGASVQLFGGNDKVASLTGAGSVELYGNGLTLANGGNYSGVIASIGGGGYLSVDSGTLTLTGASTFTGNTTVGVYAALNLGNGGTGGSLAGKVINNGTFTANRSDTLVINGLEGFGSFIQAGTGTTSVTGVNYFTGSVDVAAGTLMILDGAALQFGSGVALTGGSAVFDSSDAIDRTEIGTLSGVAGSIVRYGDDGLRITNSGNAVFAGTFDDGATPTAAKLTVAGSGSLTLSTASDLQAVGVDGATLKLTGTANLGTTTALMIDSGSLDLSGLTTPAYTAGSLSGTGGTVTLGATNLTLGAATGTFAGSIQGSGGLRVSGGTATLSGANTYTGNTVIDSGATLALSGTGSLTAAKVQANGTFYVGGSTSIAELSGSGNVSLGWATLTIAGNGGESGFTGNISQAGGPQGSVTIGSGHQTVTSTWDYGGRTTLLGSAGLTIGDGGTNGELNGAVVLGGGTLTANRSDLLNIYGVSGTGTFRLAGTGTTTLRAGAGLSNFAGNVEIANGTLVLNAATLLNAASSVALTGGDALLNLSGGFGTTQLNNLSGVANSRVQIGGASVRAVNTAATTFAGVLTSSANPFGTISFTKAGAETLTLTGQNTLSGGVLIEAGTLALADSGALGTNTKVAVNASTTLDLSGITGGTTAFGSILGDGLVSLGATTLTLNSSSSLNGFPAVFQGVIEGTGGLRIGGGTLSLGTAASTYSGDTTIDAGATLVLTRNAIANSAVVANGRLDLTSASVAITLANIAGSGEIMIGWNDFAFGANNLDSSFSGTLLGIGRVTKQGTGNLTLSGANNIFNFTVLGGDIVLTGDGAIGSFATLGLYGGGLDITGITADSLSLGDLMFNGGVNLGDKNLLLTNGGMRYGGTISGSGGVEVVGGTAVFAGAQLYTGMTTVDVGAGLYLDGGSLTGAIDIQGALMVAEDVSGTRIGGLNGGGTVELGSDLTIAGNGTFTGIASGTHGLIFSEGTSTLSGANDYSGVTTINSGATLALADAGTIGSGALTTNGDFSISGASGGVSIANLSGFGTVTLGANTLTLGSDNLDSGFAGTIAGSGGLTKTGTGVLTLYVANSYSGLTQVDAGTLRLGNSEVLADDSTLIVANGATLDMNGKNETVAEFTIQGNLIGGGTLTAQTYNFLGGTIDHDLGAGAIYQRSGTTLLNGSAAGSAVHVEGGTLMLGANERLADTALVTVLAGATLDVQGYNETVGSLALGGSLNGTGTLTAATYTLDDALVNANLGAGTLVQHSGTSLLSGTAAAGTVRVDGGTLRLGASDRLADTAASSVASGATLDLQSFNDSVGTLALAGTLSGTGTLTAATTTLDAAAVNANLGGGTLVQHSGISLLSGTATVGTVRVDGGTLRLDGADRLADSAAVTVASGATLDLQGFNDTVGTATLAGTLAGTGTLTAATTTLDGAAVNANLGGGTLVQHSGTSLLNGTAAAGTVRVDGGTLRLGSADRLVDTAAVAVVSGATLDLQGFDETVGTLALAGTLSGSGTLTAATTTLDGAAVNAKLGTGTLVQNSGTSLLSGTAATGTVRVDGGTLRLASADRLGDTAAVTVASGATFDLQGFNETVGTVALTGTLSGTGTLTATSYTLDAATVNANLGGGTLVQHSGTSLLSGTAAATTVNVDAGTLRLGATDRLIDTAAVSVASGATLDLQGFNEGVGTLALAGTLSGTGTLTATSYTLSGATIAANLGTGTLIQNSGTSLLRGSFAGNAIQLNGGTLALDHTNAVTYAGTLSGTATLAQTGTGTLTLSGNSTGFAGTTTVSAGGLAVTGQLGGNVTVSGGMLSGTGSIGGTVAISDGAHLVGTQGSTLSMGALTLSSGSSLDVTLAQPSNAALFAVAGDLTLDGTLNVTAQPGFGTGVYRILSYGGTLTDNGLVLGTVTGATTDGLSVQTGAVGQVNLVNTNGATLSFWDGAAAANRDNGRIDGGAGTWSLGGRNWTDANGTVNGAMQPVPSFAVFQGSGGAVTIDNGAGQVSATGMQFATNGYTLSGGALALSGSQATIRVGDGTAAGANVTATIGSALTGSSALVKTDLGTLVLTGANGYTGGTIVQAGTLIGDAASIQGNIQNAGTVRFDQANAGTFAGAISGTGSYVKSGAGALTLTGASSANWQVTGGSIVSTTTLFTGNADLAQGTSLVFAQGTNGNYAGTISGTGSVLFQGGGTVLLTGNSTGFAGTTTVGAGGLFSVNGTLGGTINVAAGGRLQGSGTAGSATIAGTIAPGNSIGTLTFNGNLAFVAGSVFEVEANAAGASDKIIVNGAATIANGASVSVLAENGNYGLNTSYTILTASGGVTGTFSNVTSNLAFLAPTLSYGANAVTLNLKRNTIDFIATAQTRNQSAIAPAVQALGSGNGVYDAVVALTAAEARGAFDQLSGSDYASMRGRLLDDSRLVRSAILARGALAGEPGLAVWGDVLGSWGSMDGGALAQGYNRDLKGFLAGFDGALGEHWRAGLATGYGTSELRTSSATHKAETYHAGGYVAGSYGIASIQLGAAYAWNEVRSQRRVAFGGFAGGLGDKYRADSFQAFGEVAVKGNLSGITVQPFAGLAYARLKGSDIAEQGGAAALRGGGKGQDMIWGNFGLRTEAALDLGGTTLRINGSAALRHAFGDRVPTIDLGFATGPAFTVRGNALDRDSAALDAGLELDLSKHLRLGISYTGNVAERFTDHGGRATLSWRF